LPLIENIKFCKISTQIQDMLAVSPLLRTEDRCNLDGQLVNWYSNLPWLLRTTDPCAEPLYIARCIMKWRYQNLRMLLHRPVLLSLASNTAGVGMLHGGHVAEQDLAAIETCRELAKQTIEDIAREWTRNQMSGWNAVWFLYQAAMIPLVSVFWQWDSPRVPEWHKQIETILELLEAMEDWSLAARRSREVVWRMYEASRQQPAAGQQHPALQSPLLHGMGGGVAGGEHPSMLMAADGELRMSPIGLELEGAGMVGMLDQQGLWDLDGMFWSGGSAGPVEGMGSPDDSQSGQQHPPPSNVDFGGFNVNDQMMQMDYGMISPQSASMDPGFFVH
jgi:hypothetical protein